MKAKKGPDYVALDLTYRCGFSCPFCFVKRNSLLKPGRRELGTAGFKRIIRTFADRPRHFYVTGGEPGSRADLPEIIREIKSAGHFCLITTNAWHLDPKRLKELAAAGPDELVISLHGGPSMHDGAAGRPGAFRRAASAVKLLTSLPQPRPGVTLWCTINRANHAMLPAVYKALSALGADRIAFNHLEFITEKALAATRALLPKAALTLKASEDLARGIDAAALAAGVEAVKKSGGSAVFYPDLDRAGIKAWYDPDRALRRQGRCEGQWNAAWFSPYGELLTCQPLALKLAAAGGAPLRAWAGPRYRSFRLTLSKAGGFLPVCARCGREPYRAPRRKAAC